MELSQEDKDRIVAEEKLRMETRKEFLKDNFGGMGRGPWGGWHGQGCGQGYGCRGFGFLKGLLIIVLLFGLFHFWHRPYCGGYPGYYGYPACPAPQMAPVPQPAPPK